MRRLCAPLVKTYTLVPLALAGLLLFGRPATAQIVVNGPPQAPAARALTAWFGRHVPAKFRPRGKFEVKPLSDPEMDDYLHNGDDGPHSQNDDDEIDGVFVNHPPQIVLRVPERQAVDFYTFAHEYGHYVWFDLLTQGDRRQYKTLYERQKSAHRLITGYAGVSLEEGFAEAFAVSLTDPVTLSRQDPASARFLTRWIPPTP